MYTSTDGLGYAFRLFQTIFTLYSHFILYYFITIITILITIIAIKNENWGRGGIKLEYVSVSILILKKFCVKILLIRLEKITFMFLCTVRYYSVL